METAIQNLFCESNCDIGDNGLSAILSDGVEIIGFYSPSRYRATAIVSTGGVAPCVKENHGQVTAKFGGMGGVMDCYLSEKGKRYVLDGKRGMATDINAEIRQTLTARGQSNWTGSFISSDIETVEKLFTINTDAESTIILRGGQRVKMGEADEIIKKIRIRKLTPKECWRLMGQKDEDFEKAAAVNSKTQLYKQAGNSIVVDVLEAIFREMMV